MASWARDGGVMTGGPFPGRRRLRLILSALRRDRPTFCAASGIQRSCPSDTLYKHDIAQDRHSTHPPLYYPVSISRCNSTRDGWRRPAHVCGQGLRERGGLAAMSKLPEAGQGELFLLSGLLQAQLGT
jgi:hypothetical protein